MSADHCALWALSTGNFTVVDGTLSYFFCLAARIETGFGVGFGVVGLMSLLLGFLPLFLYFVLPLRTLGTPFLLVLGTFPLNPLKSAKFRKGGKIDTLRAILTPWTL